MTTVQIDNAKHHPTFYLGHGDLVIHSSKDADNVSILFRVNKGILVFNSPVFADMARLPEERDGRDIYDGAPYVRLTDSAEDLERLFSALYDPR